MSDIRKQFLGYALVTLTAFVAYHIYYIHAVTLNIGWLTWFEQTPRLEKALEHTLTIRDLFTQYGEHGMFGYNCLAVFNVKYLALNTFFDAYLYLGASIVCALLLLWRMPLPENSSKRLLWISAALLCFLWFATTQKSAGAMDTQVRLSVCFVVINTLLLDWILNTQPRPSWTQLLGFCLFFVCSLIVFGTLYSFGWVSALLIAYVVRAIEHRSLWSRDILLLTALAAGSITYLLVYPLPHSQDHDTSIVTALIHSLSHPYDSFRFIIAYLGNGTIGRSVWSEPSPVWTTLILLNGSIITALYLACAILFFTHKVYKSSWLPLFLMLHTIGVGLLILLGRSAMFGWLGGTNEWYGLHHKLGMTGILLLLLCLLRASRETPSRLRFIKPLCIGVALYTLPLLILSEISEWKQVRHTQGFFSRMVEYAMHPSPNLIDEQGNTPMKASYGDTMRSLNFYKKYRLNIFRSAPPPAYGANLIENGKCADERVLGPGWHQQEDKGRWMMAKAEITAPAGPDGTFLIAGYAPDFQQGQTLQIKVSTGETTVVKLNAGLFQALVKAKPNELTTLTLTCSHAKRPDSNGANGDRRELGLIINNINCY